MLPRATYAIIDYRFALRPQAYHGYEKSAISGIHALNARHFSPEVIDWFRLLSCEYVGATIPPEW